MRTLMSFMDSAARGRSGYTPRRFDTNSHFFLSSFCVSAIQSADVPLLGAFKTVTIAERARKGVRAARIVGVVAREGWGLGRWGQGALGGGEEEPHAVHGVGFRPRTGIGIPIEMEFG